MAKVTTTTRDLVNFDPDQPPLAYDLRACNVVTTCHMGIHDFNTAAISEFVGGHTGDFPGTVCRSMVPMCCPMFFRTGCAHVVGNRRPIDALVATYLVIDRMVQLDILPFLNTFRPCNVVCSASLGYWLDLKALARDYPTRCTLTSAFEGLHFTLRRERNPNKPKQSKVNMVIVFKSGRLVVTGGASFQVISKQYEKMKAILVNYRLDKKPKGCFGGARKAGTDGGSVDDMAKVLAKLKTMQFTKNGDLENPDFETTFASALKSAKRQKDDCEIAGPKCRRRKPEFGTELPGRSAKRRKVTDQ